MPRPPERSLGLGFRVQGLGFRAYKGLGLRAQAEGVGVTGGSKGC